MLRMIVPEEPAEASTDRQAQLLRGTLDMCMLALLAQEPAHGYELIRRLNALGLESVGYGTVYPLLTRMRRLGLVAGAVQDSPSGPPRKVYVLTPEGRRSLTAWAQQWTTFTALIDKALTDPTSRR